MTDLVVIGQGYVGLPLSRAAVKSGMHVIGIDKNPGVVSGLNRGVSHVDDVSDADISYMLNSGYAATGCGESIAHAEYVVICVPTPLGEAGRPDLRYVEAAAVEVAQYIRPGTTVILESTTYPGTTEDLVLPILRRSGLVLEEHFWLAFSPERIDPGNLVYGLENTPKVVGGVTEKSTRKAVSLYSKFVSSVVPVRGAKEAETAKLLENTYRHINIALVNEMARFCHELDIDLWDVIEAAKTKPFGFQAFYPGPGVGGHCIPIDPNYLSFQVEKSLGYPFKFVELATEVNNSMPRYIVQRIQDLLNGSERSLSGAKVLLLGVSYKANIADQRESPALPIGLMLQRKGACVSYYDPHVSEWHLGDEQKMRSVADWEEAVCGADLVVLLQAHSLFDVNEIAAKARMLLDTRGKVTPGRSAVRL